MAPVVVVYTGEFAVTGDRSLSYVDCPHNGSEVSGLPVAIQAGVVEI